MTENYFKEQFDIFSKCNNNKVIVVSNSEIFSLITEYRMVTFNKKCFDRRLLDYMETDVGICSQCKDYCTRWFLLARKKIE
jgi:hypothetical protein